MAAPRKASSSTAQRANVTELLIVHQALEGWIHRQHVITREIVQAETAKLRKEIAALRRDVRLARRRVSR